MHYDFARLLSTSSSVPAMIKKQQSQGAEPGLQYSHRTQFMQISCGVALPYTTAIFEK